MKVVLSHRTFRIHHTWHKRALPPEQRACVQAIWDERGHVCLRWSAPWMSGPTPHQAPGSCWGLWEYSVIELFLASEEGPYVELEFGPAGHWLGIAFEQYRSPLRLLADVDYRWWRSGERWYGRARVDVGMSHHWRRGNAFMIQRHGGERTYAAAHNALEGETKPDFHRSDGYLQW